MEQLAQHIKSKVQISEHALDIVLDRFTERHFTKREHLISSHHYANELFFILTGCLRTYVTDFNGVEHNVSFAIENWWSGDLQSFLNQKHATYSIQALERTETLSINYENWNYLIQEIPAFLAYTRILFRNTMFSQQNRIVQNLSFTAEERYDAFLSEYPHQFQRISQKHIASYLGITPEFLSMLRSRKRR